MTTFTVYIDESGDDGFVFRDPPALKGSSDWLVLTAVIVQTARDHEIRRIAAQIRVALGMAPKTLLHFAGLKHEKRVRAIHDISTSDLCVSSVIINKRAIQQPEVFTAAKGRLYFYTARLLLERISWYCRDAVPAGQQRRARIIFEHRKRLSYEDLRDYVILMRGQAQADAWHQLLLNDVRIDWGVVSPDHIEAAQKDQFAGLQLADLAASGLRWALESSPFENTEHRFAKMLPVVTYKRGNNYLSYGLKFFPHGLAINDPKGHWVRKHYQ